MVNNMTVLQNSFKTFEPLYKIYKVWLKIALFASSFYFPYIFLMAYFSLPKIYIEYSFVVFIFAIHLSNIKKYPFVKKIIYGLSKIIKILGSLFVIFLVVNSYLKMFDIFYKFYISFWNIFEVSLNRLVIGETFTIAFPFVAIHIIGLLFKLKTSNIVKTLLTAVFLIFSGYAYSVFKTGEINDLLLPFLGFSLLLLHMDYLWDEARGFLIAPKDGEKVSPL